MSSAPVSVSAAVEGSLDEVVLRKICGSCEVSLGTVFGRSGKQFVLTRLAGYNNSARFRHWVVLVDLDHDFDCAPAAVANWLPEPARLMRLRIAVREVEAWLLADPEQIAEFLGVRQDLIPLHPDSLVDPKQTLIRLVRHSRTRAIREDIIPDPSTGSSEGPAYTSRMIEYVNQWRPTVAALNSASLSSCIEAIQELATHGLL